MTTKYVTWLGEDPSDTVPGPSFNIWGDPLTKAFVRFDKGQAVKISDEEGTEPNVLMLAQAILTAAPTNRFYKVDDAPPPARRRQGEEEDEEPPHGRRGHRGR
jgi:hypothetical protein